MIVAALTAGAVAGAQGTASEMVRDTYNGLKALVKSRLRGQPAGEAALERHEKKPGEWRNALEAELNEAGAAQDGNLIQLAQRLTYLLNLDSSTSKNYDIDLRGAQGVQVGDHNFQSNKFEGPSQPSV